MSAPADVLVVGASVAGLSTVEALRRKGYQGRITVVGDESGPPYDRPPLSKQVLSGAWQPERSHLRTEEQLGALDAEFHHAETAVSLDVGTRTVHTDSGRALGAEVLVLATGAHPRRLPGQQGLQGVHLLRTLDDSLALRAALSTTRRLVVIGDGVLGCETAATAAQLGVHTTLVGLQTAPMAAQLGSRIASHLAGLHTRNGVRVLSSTGVGGLAHAHGQVTGVHLSTGEVQPADAVVVAIGCAPATDWLVSSGLQLDDGIVCDARCRAAPGIYAVGDVARWYHQDVDEHVRLENRTNATAQAGAVAADILGARTAYRPVPYFWTDQFDTRVQVFGTPASDAQITVVEGEEGQRFVARYERDGHTSAVLGWNMPKQARLHGRTLSTPPAPAPSDSGSTALTSGAATSAAPA